jgi:CRISPR/Cas system CSM-associated protein Csm3 (group 7 of RAMP superfamily)
MYRLTLTTVSALLIDGQYRTFAVDKATARRISEQGHRGSDRFERPIIPAAALKGAMRIDFERLMRALERPVCHGPDPERMCDTEPCIVCRLFGGPGDRPGRLRFADALPLTRQYRELYIQRMGVGLSRSLRRAESGLLFAQEAMPSGLRLETQIQTLEPLAPQDQHDFEAVLNWWCQEGLSIGGGRSRGMGHVTLEWVVDTLDTGVELFPAEAPVLPSQQRSRLFHLFFTPTTESEEPIRVSAVKLRSYFLGSLGFIPGSTYGGQ